MLPIFKNRGRWKRFSFDLLKHCKLHDVKNATTEMLLKLRLKEDVAKWLLCPVQLLDRQYNFFRFQKCRLPKAMGPSTALLGPPEKIESRALEEVCPTEGPCLAS